MTPEEMVDARQPEENDGRHFVRKFRMRLHEMADEILHDGENVFHTANKDETKADAIRRGLRPTGDAELVDVEADQDHHVLTYQVPVEVTPSAAEVSVQGKQENDPAQTTLDDPEPSQKVLGDNES